MGDRIGVRGRLLLAFLGISAFAVLAAGAAMYAFLNAGKALDRITQDRVPATIASQQLSRQAERITAAAPSLLTVNTNQEHERMSKWLANELDGLESQLHALENVDVDPNSLIQINQLVELLRINLTTVDSMVINTLVLVELRTELLRKLSLVEVSARRLLSPSLLVMDAKLSELRRIMGQSGSPSTQRSRRISDLAEPIISSAPLQRAQSEVSTINDTLVKVASSKTIAELDVLLFPLRRSMATLEELLPDIDPNLAARLGKRLSDFRELVEGDSSIPRARRMELHQLDSMKMFLDQNVEISAQLTRSVDHLVARANRDIHDATEDALSVQRTSTVIMITVVFMSLVCSALIVWLYVSRNLIARLTDLSDSMLAIAAGDLQANIPAGGTDEIGSMAKALGVFRDTAVEVRATNLREIREARRRLTEAIEAIDEGFSLYDAEDRLVLCNSRYRDDLYPGIADVMIPGTPFETVVRTAAERGLIKGVEGHVDQWVTERMARYHDPKEPHLQEQSDGRWVRIDECKTEDGGTVAVYSDITELVKQSEQLEAWNKKLEERVASQIKQLQNVGQLKRFFPPQLADAIVSENQAAILEDHRREITVVFCDLRGFTEFSSLAEPEEQMRVLREYHGVICPLIFEYGATLEHFAGDGVMCFLNDPVPYPDHIERAIDMSIAMRTGMSELREQWVKREIELGFGIGIGTGYATLGRIGTQEHFHYAAIGSVANLAARLCDEAEDEHILLAQRAHSAVEGRFAVEPVGELSLKGFLRPVMTYNLLERSNKRAVQ